MQHTALNGTNGLEFISVHVCINPVDKTKYDYMHVSKTLGNCGGKPERVFSSLPTVILLVYRCLHTPALPSFFKSCALISRGPDAKTRGHQNIAYTCTDARIVYSVVT